MTASFPASSGSGNITLANPGWENVPAILHWRRDATTIAGSATLGGIYCHAWTTQSAYSWISDAWSRVSGDAIPGYPAALPAGPPPYGWTVRVIWVEITAPGCPSTVAVHSTAQCPTVGGDAVGSSNFADSVVIPWSISIGALPGDESRAFDGVAAGQAYPLHPSDLRTTFKWKGDVSFSASVGGASYSGTISWDSQNAPTFIPWLLYSPGYTARIKPPMGPGYDFARLGSTDSVTWVLSEQFASLETGNEVDLATVATYYYTSGSISGVVTATGWADEVLTDWWAHAESVNVTSALTYLLRVYDQLSVMGSGLTAMATYVTDPFAVPGSATITNGPTSRNSDPTMIGPCTLTLVDAGLEAFDLPTADNKCQFDLGPLDWISGALDEGYAALSNGVRYGILKLYRQSPLSVQWAQDDRGSAAPPSWWTWGGSPAPRSTLDCTVALGAAGTLRRKLSHYVWDAWTCGANLIVTDTNPPNGTTLANAHKFMFNFDNSVKGKHGLAGLTWGADVPITAGVVDWAAGTPTQIELQASEDVYSWDNYGYVKLTVSTTYSAALDCKLNVEYQTYTIEDTHDSDAGDRSAAWAVITTGTLEVVYSFTVSAGATSEAVYLDIFSAGNPRLQVVEAVEIDLPAGTGNFTLHNVELVGRNPVDLTDLGDARLELVYPRKMRYGKEARYDANSTLLGYTYRPEEATAAWLFGDGCVGYNSPDDELHDVAVAPEGIESWNYVVTDVGKDQSALRDLTYWVSKVSGDWGQEGIYGTYTVPTAPWLDGDAASIGALYFSDVPELLWKLIEDEDLLTAARDADGTVDMPVAVRCGSVSPAEGMNWANDQDGDKTYGDPIVFPSRKFLYGSRIDTVYTVSGSSYLRVAEDKPMSLYEQKTLGGVVTERLCCTDMTDKWGRIRASHGANEKCHTETGATSDPDADRPAFLSDLTNAAHTYGRAHYQEIPTANLSVWVPSIPAAGEMALDLAGRVWVALTNGAGMVAVQWRHQMNGGTWHIAGYPFGTQACADPTITISGNGMPLVGATGTGGTMLLAEGVSVILGSDELTWRVVS
jgi:hypothetical protein